jgi:hypothetical protein
MPMIGTMSVGKMAASRSGKRAPSRVGPSAIPAATSPITRGWRSRTATHPHPRATSMTTAMARKNCATVSAKVRLRVALTVCDPTPRVSARSAAVPATLASPPRRHRTRPARVPLA